MLKIHLLGAFRLCQDELDLPVKSMRQQALLAYLLLHASAPQPRYHIAFQLWPDASESQARNSLRNLLSQIRQLLPELDLYLEVDSTSLQWKPQLSYWCDVHEVDNVVALAANATGHERRVHLERVVELYTGELLPSCYDDWILPQRAQLQRNYIASLSGLIDLLEEQRAFRTAVTYATRLIEADALDEAAYRRLMRLHLADGDFTSVHRVFEQCVKMLHDELGVEPESETVAIAMQAKARIPTTLAAISPQPVPRTVTPQERAEQTALVGREAEWATVYHHWQRTLEGQSSIVLLTGEVGIGKTRLAEELLAMVHRQGFPVARANCFATGGDFAYSPILAWLRAPSFADHRQHIADVWLIELSRLLPEIYIERSDLPPAGPITDSWQRQRLRQALVQAILSAGQPALLFLDDMHWADRDTMQWLLYLFQQPLNPPLLLVATLRDEDSLEHPWLQSALVEWRRRGILAELTLNRLSSDQTKALAESVAGQAVTEDAAALLYVETQGNPLFIVEMARAGIEHVGVNGDGQLDGRFPVLPAKIQAAIESRLERLSDDAKELVQLVAVIGREFSVTSLALATGKEEWGILNAVEELWNRRLIQEAQGGETETAFIFTHESVRTFVYQRIGVVRRRILHRRIADAMAAQHSSAENMDSGQIALHYELAGSLDQAVRYYIRAGEYVAQLHAYYRAEQLFAHAQQIAARLNLPADTLIQIYTQRGRMLELAEQYEQAIRVYEEFDRLAQRRGDQRMEAIAVVRLAACYVEPNDVHSRDRALPLLSRGARLIEQLGDDKVEAGLLWCQMLDAFYYGHDADVHRYGMRAVALARQHKDDVTLSFLLNTLAGSLHLSGRQSEGHLYAEEARSLFRRFNNLPYLARNLNQQAWDAYHQLDFAAARTYAQQSAEISARVYSHWNFALAKLIMGIVDAQHGEWGDALRHYEGCLRLSEEHHLVMIKAYAHLEQGRLYRNIGLLDKAVEALTSGYRACQQNVQFLSHTTAIQLAATEFTRQRLQEGRQWLERAQHHNNIGAFARVWNILDAPAWAAVFEAEITGQWAEAQHSVEGLLAEAMERKLPLFLPSLRIAQAHVLFGLGDYEAAESALAAARAIAHAKNQLPWLWRIALLRIHIAHRQGDDARAKEQQQVADQLASTLAERLPRPLPQIFLESAKNYFPS